MSCAATVDAPASQQHAAASTANMWRRAARPERSSSPCRQSHRCVRHQRCDPPEWGSRVRASRSTRRVITQAATQPAADRCVPASGVAPWRNLRMPRSGLFDRRWLRPAGASAARSIRWMGQAKSPLVGEGAHPHGGGERIRFSSSIDDVQGWKKGGESACLGMGERTGQLDLRGLERAARSKANACSTLGAVIARDDSCENPWRTGLRLIQI